MDKNLYSIDISTASSVRNLGAIFDSALSSEAIVNSICKSAWFNLFNISRSRRSLTTDAAKILIQAYVMSKIDYCNSLLYGIPNNLICFMGTERGKVVQPENVLWIFIKFCFNDIHNIWYIFIRNPNMTLPRDLHLFRITHKIVGEAGVFVVM